MSGVDGREAQEQPFIPEAEPAAERDADRTVYAAGAVLWRLDEGRPRILIAHRERHDDWSLPKGKVDPGESLPETAVREVREETGLEIRLGAPLGRIEYGLPNGRPKEVHYWLAEVDGAGAERVAAFEPNEEVDALEWASLKKAAKRLSYERDRELVGVVADRFDAGTARTFPIALLRHGKATPPLEWPGDDASRPLTSRGLEQAEAVVPILAAYGLARLITSPAVRCRETIQPYAAERGAEPEVEAAISQAAYDEDQTLEGMARELVEGREAALLCSHSPVIPEIIRAIAAETGTREGRLARQGMLSTGEFAVLHIPAEDPARGIVAAETHGPIA